MTGDCAFMNDNIPTKEQVRQLFKEKLAEISQGSADDKNFRSIFNSLQNQDWQTVNDAIQTLSISDRKFLVRVAFTYLIDRQGRDELSRLTSEIRNLIGSIRLIAPQREKLEFYISFRTEADGPDGPMDTCMAKGFYHRPVEQ
jgi:hypothetical protein